MSRRDGIEYLTSRFVPLIVRLELFVSVLENLSLRFALITMTYRKFLSFALFYENMKIWRLTILKNKLRECCKNVNDFRDFVDDVLVFSNIEFTYGKTEACFFIVSV